MVFSNKKTGEHQPPQDAGKGSPVWVKKKSEPVPQGRAVGLDNPVQTLDDKRVATEYAVTTVKSFRSSFQESGFKPLKRTSGQRKLMVN